MSASFPPLPDELVAFVHGGVSLLSGTCSAALVPESQRACGIRIWPGACRLTLWLPKATGEVAVANLRENPRIAITASQIQTHRTVQLKGNVLEVREATEADRATIDTWFAGFRASLAWVGVPENLTLGYTAWPAWAVDVDIVNVFAQTPGPVAGVKMPLPAGQNL